MRVALLSPFTDISSIGIRSISSYLKSHDISTRLLFLPLQKNFYARELFTLYSDEVVDQIADCVQNDDLIGISLMSNFFETVKDLTLKLRKRLPDKKIIWGGVHATVLPEKCIEFADYLCIGEGEISMLDLCNKLSGGKPTNSIQGIWSRQDNQIFRNAPTEFILDLNQIPPPDYDLENNYILIQKKQLIPLTEKNMRDFLGLTYWTMYSRGCPFSCAYCCNDAYKRIHKDLVKLRAKSPQDMIKELEAIQRKFPYVRYINFQDDTFFALPEKEIKAFSEHYQQHIQLPFLVPGLNPSVFTEKKFDYLVKAGLLRTRMGIQSGSSHVVQEIYKRTQDNQKIIEISKSLQKYSNKMSMPNYDIIIDNPWETKEELLKTIYLLDRLAPPFSLNIFSLEFFPGTRLYDRALKENLFSEDGSYKPYYHYEYTYLNLIILMYAVFKIPKWLLKILLTDSFVQTNKEFRVLHGLFYNLMLYRRGLCALAKRDYSMFPVKLQFFFSRILPPHEVNKEKPV